MLAITQRQDHGGRGKIMKKVIICLYALLVCGLFCHDSIASELNLELDRVFYSSNPALQLIHGTAYANDDTLWVADATLCEILQYNPDQPDTASTTPLFNFGLRCNPQFRDAAWDHDMDTLWVAFRNGDIVNYNQSGSVIGSFNAGGQHLSGLAYHDNYLYVSFKDASNGWQKYSTSGSLENSFSFQGNVGTWSGLAYDEERELVWAMHHEASWQAYNPTDGTLVAELDWSVVADLGWNIALSYGDGALWAGAMQDNTIGRLRVFAVPTANAGPDLVIKTQDQDITIIQGSASDLDGDPLTFRWLEGTNELSEWQPVGATGEAYLDLNLLDWFSVGDHTLTLEVDDGEFTSTDDMNLTVGIAPGGYVKIDHVKITDPMQNPTWVFGKYDPPLMTMEYTLTEALTRKYSNYRVIPKIKAFGQILKEVRRDTPAGTYTHTNTVLPNVPPGEYPIVFRVIVKEGTAVVGKKAVVRYVTIVE